MPVYVLPPDGKVAEQLTPPPSPLEPLEEPEEPEPPDDPEELEPPEEPEPLEELEEPDPPEDPEERPPEELEEPELPDEPELDPDPEAVPELELVDPDELPEELWPGLASAPASFPVPQLLSPVAGPHDAKEAMTAGRTWNARGLMAIIPLYSGGLYEGEQPRLVQEPYGENCDCSGRRPTSARSRREQWVDARSSKQCRVAQKSVTFTRAEQSLCGKIERVAMTTILRGGCHCGNIKVGFETALDPGSLPLRACQCSFCVRHGGVSTSDPAGRLVIEAREPEQLQRYRFALGITDFLICRRCGVYVAPTMKHGSMTLGVLNVNVLDDREPFARPPTPMEYGAETVESREVRRAKAWMPVEVRTSAR